MQFKTYFSIMYLLIMIFLFQPQCCSSEMSFVALWRLKTHFESMVFKLKGKRTYLDDINVA